jgi:EH domain-containing protein 1
MLLIGHIRKHMPTMFGKDKAQKKMLDSLPDIFHAVRGWGH